MGDSEPDTANITLFGQQYDASNGTISFRQTLTVEQAVALQRAYVGATSVQEAVRMGVTEGLKNPD